MRRLPVHCGAMTTASSSWRTPLVVLACGCLIMTISFGIRAGFGFFLQPMSAEYGWGREVFSFSIALQNLMWGALGALAGGFADRFGPGRVVAVGAICYILGLVGLAYIDVPWLLHLNAGLLLGGALGGTSFGIILAVIGRTVAPEKRSLYMGIATAAGSFGQFTLVPLTQVLIATLNWHNALLVLAGIAALIIPLSLALASKPAAGTQSTQSLGEALREAIGEKGYHMLFWGYFVCGFHIAMLTVHLPAFVTDAGLRPEHGMMARDYPDVRANTVSSFALGDYEWILAFEADELHRIVDLMRHLRGSETRRHVREEVPFFTGRRRPVGELIDELP